MDNSDLNLLLAQAGGTPPKRSFLRRNWYHFVYLLLILVALATGLFLGRGPSKTVEVVVEKEKIVYQDRIVEKIVEVAAKTKDEDRKERTHKVTTIVQTPDAGTTTTIVESTGTDTQVREAEIRFVDRFVDRIVTEEKFLEKTVTVTVEGKRPGFLLSALGMVDLNRAISEPQNAFAAGLQAQGRIIGPVWASGFVAVGPSGQPTPRIYAGITLGLEF